MPPTSRKGGAVSVSAYILIQSEVGKASAVVEAVRNLFPRPASRDITATRAILTNDVVMIPDVLCWLGSV